MAATILCTDWRVHTSMLLLLASLLLLLPARTSGALTYDVYNETLLGHSRDANGEFIFGSIPPDSDAPSNVTEESMMIIFESFSLFAKAIVDSVQTQSFPYDLLRRIMYNSYDETEVIAYQTNIIITCVVVVVIIIALITLMIVYTVIHWRNRKQNSFILKKRLFDQKRGRIIIIFGFVFGVFNLAFLMLSLIVSTSTNTSMKEMDGEITGAMDGVSGYFNHSGEQWDFMSNDTNIWSLITVMQSDVNDIGSLIWQPAVQQYTTNLIDPFTKTSNLDNELAEAVSYLSDMQSQINAILSSSSGDTLTSVMSEIYYNLTFARSDFTCFGCDGSCANCSDIVVDDIYYNMDFTKLTNVTSNLQTLQSLMSTIISGSLINPEYYFWKGIGDYIEIQNNVSGGMAGLSTSLEAYSASISGSTSGIITPDEVALKFDHLRSDWNTWYESAYGQDTARYAFHLIFAFINVSMLMVLYIGWALLVLPGLFKLKPEDDNFKLPRHIILVCLIVSLCLSIGFLALAVGGFYAGANTESAVCKPARTETIVNETVDYTDAIPGHDGLYLSSIVLGNGSLYPLYVTDTLEICRANNTTSYDTFRQDLLVPNIYQDLNYTQFFVNVSSYFDAMYIDLPNVTLVPPLLEEWYSNFTDAAFYNLTEYDEFLNKGVINANLTTFVSNLLTVYSYNYPEGPMEPAKSRLYEVSQSLQDEESALNTMTNLKDGVLAAFNSYSNLINSINNNLTAAISALKAAEDDLQSRSDDFIAEGVDLHRVTFMEQLYAIQNQSQTWVTEVGPCMPLANSYDMAVNSFCYKYADNANATWILVGHTVFFLLLLSLTSFLLYREIPQASGDGLDEDLDIKKEFPKVFGHKNGCCCFLTCCGKGKGKKYQAESRPQTANSSRGNKPKSSHGFNRRVSDANLGMAPMATRIRK